MNVIMSAALATESMPSIEGVAQVDREKLVKDALDLINIDSPTGTTAVQGTTRHVLRGQRVARCPAGDFPGLQVRASLGVPEGGLDLRDGCLQHEVSLSGVPRRRPCPAGLRLHCRRGHSDRR